MESEPARDISELLSDPNVLLEAMREAADDAIQQHKRWGLPLAVWRDGAVAWVSPEELEKQGEDGNETAAREKGASVPDTRTEGPKDA